LIAVDPRYTHIWRLVAPGVARYNQPAMNSLLTWSPALLAALLAGLPLAQAAPAKVLSMSRETLRDKIRGGWAGQMIGVAYGAPTEFKSNSKIGEGELQWKTDMLANTIDQDDLYVEMTFARSWTTSGSMRRPNSMARRSERRNTTSGTPTPAPGARSIRASRPPGPATRSTTSTPTTSTSRSRPISSV
jgi:hypothetical protein